VLRLRRKLLEQTFSHLRACGAGRRECIAYWLGPRSTRGEVTEVVHPRHAATATSYDVDGTWLNELWLRLAHDELELRAQVHTHPGAAFHSSRDDNMAAIQLAGFCSLVIPGFARGRISLDGAHLVWRDVNGAWQRASTDGIEVI
jgi:hypothetical protein